MTDPLNRSLHLLGIARRAGAVCPGFEAAAAAVKRKKAKLVLTAADLSERTVRELKRLCERCGCPALALPFESEELGRALGIKCGCLALTDEGFAERLPQLLDGDLPTLRRNAEYAD